MIQVSIFQFGVNKLMIECASLNPRNPEPCSQVGDNGKQVGHRLTQGETVGVKSKTMQPRARRA